MDQNKISEIKTQFESAQNILILLQKQPSIDEVASGLALFESFNKAGKITSIACPTLLSVSYSNLFFIDKVESKINNKNLIISLDYSQGSIEKVSYNVEGDKFRLIIQPKTGYSPISKDQASFSYSGFNADLIFFIGGKQLTDLGEFYQDNNETFSRIPLINITRFSEEVDFGKINFNTVSSSYSETILNLLNKLDLKIDSDNASNLLTGIETETNGFNKNSSADTFEAIALCLRLGAKRFYRKDQIDTKQLSPSNNNLSEPIPPLNQTTSNIPADISVQKTNTKPPPDWLQPKIYKGGQLL